MLKTLELAPRINTAPPDAEWSAGFLEFLRPLHREFTPRQRALAGLRRSMLEEAHRGNLPHHGPGETGDWKIDLPAWIADQRNQMTGPADDAELVVKMLNSGAPGVMLDLEDSMANAWPNLTRGIENIVAALHGTLAYFDRKRESRVAIRDSKTVLFTRPRGLHIHQAGVFGDVMSASLFDVASVVWRVDPSRLKHPLVFYIPKSESAAEATWWRDLFREAARRRGLPINFIKCMALVESHPLAYHLEPFVYNLRDHLVGLNLGRWDYMASLLHYTLPDPRWVLPDRNTIPHDVPFFQNLRHLIVETCHRHGMLAIGGMTALFPDRTDAALNARAMAGLGRDKLNEALCGFDGAWTGHPDQNGLAVAQFPAPNQITAREPFAERRPDLRPVPRVGRVTVEGTRAAVRTAIQYRANTLKGRGASLIGGYMEDLATDRIYRLMIAQRVKHGVHSWDEVRRLFDEEGREFPGGRDATLRMIESGEFDPM